MSLGSSPQALVFRAEASADRRMAKEYCMAGGGGTAEWLALAGDLVDLFSRRHGQGLWPSALRHQL